MYGFGRGSVRSRIIGLTDPESHNHVTKRNANNNKNAAGAPSINPKSKWVTDDGYNLAAFGQTVGAWQIHHPLPLPQWMPKSKKTLCIENVSIVHNHLCKFFIHNLILEIN